MKIIRYSDKQNAIHYAVEHPDGLAERLEGCIYENPKPTGESADVAKLLAPIEPKAIFCIGLNYGRHAEETGARIPSHPVLFMKSPGALQHPGDPIEIPTALASHQVDYECELAIVIGKKCKNATRASALEYVLGYTCANDVSARDWQKDFGGSQWCRGKTFDTFAPLGPCLVTPDEIPNPNALGIRTILNGQTVQDWNTDDMIFDVPAIIEFLSGSTTLLPGSVILTGTPHGVGMASNPPRWLKPGDTVSIEIDQIGKLTNPVIEEK
jgi:2-keto-4-pentenoate hydratase/2-oxohepta-3-ene-1,7-dioic acid hydratase in catechol pathway